MTMPAGPTAPQRPWMLDRILDLLACPECQAALQSHADHLVCPKCHREYPVRGGVPILLPPDSQAARDALASDDGRRMSQEYETGRVSANSAPPPSRFREFLSRLQAPELRVPAAGIERMYGLAGAATRIVSIGGGPTRNNERDINLNLAPFPNVDLVGDAHRLPLRSGAVDGVWCNAVLEHVEDAGQVAREIERVVRPGGMIFVLQPFLFAYHAYPADYRRLTLTGLEKLFPNLEKLESGTAVGPTYGLIKLGEAYLLHYLPALLQIRNERVLRFIRDAYSLLFYPLQRLDRRLARTAAPEMLACMVYYLGRKPD